MVKVRSKCPYSVVLGYYEPSEGIASGILLTLRGYCFWVTMSSQRLVLRTYSEPSEVSAPGFLVVLRYLRRMFTRHHRKSPVM
jgi:hypothetical protein